MPARFTPLATTVTTTRATAHRLSREGVRPQHSMAAAYPGRRWSCAEPRDSHAVSAADLCIHRYVLAGATGQRERSPSQATIGQRSETRRIPVHRTSPNARLKAVRCFVRFSKGAAVHRVRDPESGAARQDVEHGGAPELVRLGSPRQILPGQIASTIAVRRDRAARPFIASGGSGNLGFRGQLCRGKSG
jgi:hypothetical protein